MATMTNPASSESGTDRRTARRVRRRAAAQVPIRSRIESSED
jgi:hypothetical protein